MRMNEEIRKLNDLARIPMKTEREMRMVEIIVLKYKTPEVEVKCVKHILENTSWPYKLTVYDNRLNTASTARIWNKLIRDATCDYILFLDSDAFVPQCEPCWLSRMMQCFDHPSCKVVVPVSNQVGNDYQRADGARAFPAAEPHNGKWSGLCWLTHRSVFEEIGYLDEEFYIYGQDSEFSYRLGKVFRDATYIRRDVYVEHIGSYSFLKAHQDGELNRDADRKRSRILVRQRMK